MAFICFVKEDFAENCTCKLVLNFVKVCKCWNRIVLGIDQPVDIFGKETGLN